MDIQDLTVRFADDSGWRTAVRSLSLQVREGEVVGLIGESGSGKSVTSSSLLWLLPLGDRCRLTAERLDVLGLNVLDATEREMRNLRGAQAAMVFQEPMTALDPLRSIRRHMHDVLLAHKPQSSRDAYALSKQLLSEMGIEDPDRVLHCYPHQLSGGMRQRVLLAMAFSCNPRLIIADEPLTALDVTTQHQIVKLVRRKTQESGVAILFVSHDLSVVRSLCERVYVMYAGEVVETGPAHHVLTRPHHPYTQGLLASRPELFAPRTRLDTIAGQAPSGADAAEGCQFRDRCPHAFEKCSVRPPLQASAGDPERASACWLEGAI
ncbi:MAG: ABC transporter ATP-binding protein [Parvularcula sp.]|nr:ABC transporter ATP-binding protein [Parvularcula sp.]